MYFNEIATKREVQRGFSIIELIVSVSILLMLSMALLFNYNDMNQRITLDNLAHQTAQWVRSAQVIAMSVRHTADATVFPGYGLYFDKSANDRFVFFADLDGDKRYDPPGVGEKCGDAGVECQKPVILPKGSSIAALCGDSASTPNIDCGSFTSAEKVEVVFTRPDPDATIKTSNTAGATFTSARARVKLVSSKGYSRIVEVWTTGQVSLQ